MNRNIHTKTYVEKAETVVINENEKPPLPSNIPSPKGFIGRVDELAQLQTAKDSGKTSFVLHGAGGVGKTDFALEFIRRSRADYQADIRVDMQGLSDKPLPPNAAKLEVIRVFEPNVRADLSDANINKLYESFLNQHRTILFLDNAKDRAQVEPLNNASALTVITSRETFNVSGGFTKEIEQMSPADARQLLYSMAGETRFDGQADALAYLAGYLPMALLPLAALLVDDITLEAKDLVQRYADRQKRLQLADPNRENLSVEASFDLSYDTLHDELQTFWRKLAVFPADFDLEAMQFVWQIESGMTLRAELVNKHLLEFDSETKRSKLHDLARDYTNEKLNESERFQTEAVYCVYYGKLFASLPQATLPNLNIFDLERTNIENGFALLAVKIEQDEGFAQLCGLYAGQANHILMIRLHMREYLKWLETGLKAAQKLGNKQQIGASLNNLGTVHRSLGEYQKAIDYLKQALAIAEEIKDFQGKGIVLSTLGTAYFSLGEYQQGINFFTEALEIARETGDRKGEGSRLGNLGNAFLKIGEYQKAIDSFEESLAIAREISDRRDEGTAIGGLGTLYAYLENFQEAAEYHNQALEIAREIGDRQNEGTHLGNLGADYERLGEKEKARDYYLQAVAILEAIESPNVETYRQNLELLEDNG